jgi:hypothetical protein
VYDPDSRFVHPVISEQSSRDIVENVSQSRALFVYIEGMVQMLVTQVFHVRCQVAKED